MSIFPKASIAFWTSWSGTPALVRSPAKTAVSPLISRRGLLGDVAVEVVDQDLRALLGEQLGRGAADAARRAGDDRRLAVEYSHSCFSSFELGPQERGCQSPYPSPRFLDSAAFGPGGGGIERLRRAPTSRAPASRTRCGIDRSRGSSSALAAAAPGESRCCVVDAGCSAWRRRTGRSSAGSGRRRRRGAPPARRTALSGFIPIGSSSVRMSDEQVVARVNHGALLRVRADRERGHAVSVDVVGAVLGVVLDHEDQRAVPIDRVRDSVDDLAERRSRCRRPSPRACARPASCPSCGRREHEVVERRHRVRATCCWVNFCLKHSTGTARRATWPARVESNTSLPGTASLPIDASFG